ncbi:hypothetical protein CEP53_015030 [Fusarium sp. AF-6]|nr:hypothetical protein CEP53_015030 [Fusarium sp. AF-6]
MASGASRAALGLGDPKTKEATLDISDKEEDASDFAKATTSLFSKNGKLIVIEHVVSKNSP